MTREQEIANLKVIVEYEKQEYQRSIQKAPNEVKTVLGQIRDIHLKALEKQIPIVSKTSRCSRCGSLNIELNNYCSQCGQAIDWED